MRNIVIEKIEKIPIEQQKVELVEHKGIGHPDTICDAVCEAASVALSKYYLKEFGHIFHHNIDKGLLIAGKSAPKFGGGKVLEPIKIIIAGRVTNKIENKLIPVDEISIEAAKNYIHKNLRAIEKDYAEITTDIKSGSGDLQEVFKRAKEMPLANDTSVGSAYAPLSETENIVLKTGKLINSIDFRKKFPAVGEDIKVMAFRNKDEIKLMIAIAFIDKYISSIEEYRIVKQTIIEQIEENVKKITDKKVKNFLNTLDDPKGKKEEDVYLTVTGLSAEMGDDGQVGRGNRTNGLLSANRPMSLEAPAGKNPVAHTGKIYNVLASLIANDIVEKLKLKEVYVKLLSQIGYPVDQPAVASVQVLDDLDKQIEKQIYEITDSWLTNVKKVTKMIINQEVSLF